MPSAHAEFGPSRIPMFIRCPGSIQLARKVETKRDSSAAAEGTVAHHVREMVLEMGFDLEDYLGKHLSADGFTFEVTEEMIEYLRPGIEWVEERPGRVINEYQVNLDRWMPGQFGTLDVGIIGKKLITINDLKYGMGVAVDPVRHEPTMAYALGLWDNVAQHETKAKEFLIVIDQPRIAGAGGEWRVSLDELLDFGEELRAAFEAANGDDPELVPGEKQCMFCEAKGICPAYAEWSMDMIDLEFDDFEDETVRVSDYKTFTPEKRALIAKHKGVIEKWLKAVHAQVADDAYRGNPTPGLKLVKGRNGPRTWANENAAAGLILPLLDPDVALGEPPLISPTGLEALVKKNEFPDDVWTKLQKLVSQSEGKPSLVDEDDDKPALNITDEFDDLDDDESE